MKRPMMILTAFSLLVVGALVLVSRSVVRDAASGARYTSSRALAETATSALTPGSETTRPAGRRVESE